MSQVFVTTHSDHINIDGLSCFMSFNVLTLQLCIEKRFLIKNKKNMTNSINERNIVLVSQETELFWLQM